MLTYVIFSIDHAYVVSMGSLLEPVLNIKCTLGFTIMTDMCFYRTIRLPLAQDVF